MNQAWSEVSLGQIAEVVGGGTPSTKDLSYWGGEVAWITPKDLARLDGRFVAVGDRSITVAGLEASSAKVVPSGTLIVSSRAPIGYVAIAASPLATNQGCRSLVFKDDEPSFFYYVLKSSTEKLEALANGTTFREISGSGMKRVAVPRPPLDQQKAIASVLGAFDDKIEQRRQTAFALEQLTRLIFRAWFVDFEPVKARVAGATAFPSMPQHVFDALPTHFDERDAGLVPQGWAVRSIGDVVAVKGGGTPSTKNPEYWDGGKHCWATPKDMSRLRHPVLVDTERHITDSGVNSISSGILPVGTVLMSSRAPVGYLAIAAVPTAINQGFIAMLCDGPLPPVYVINWAVSSMDMIKAHASGTTFPEISKKNFRPLPVIVPTPDVVAAYHQAVSPFFDLLASSVREIEELANIRDFLLRRILSGDVRVRT